MQSNFKVNMNTSQYRSNHLLKYRYRQPWDIKDIRTINS